MPKIFATCIVTGQPIDTGIEIDETSFVRLPSFVGRVFCDHCASEHEWGKDNARLVDGERQAGRGKPSGKGGP